MKRYFVSLLAFGYAALSCCAPQKDTGREYKVWFDKPATYFEEALVLGNGIMGATVYGGILKDSIHLNDATLWSGEPVDPNMNPNAHKHIPAIREALANEDHRLADSLNRFVQGAFSQSFAPLGNLNFTFHHTGEASNYKRELDINNAIANTTYTVDGVNFSREYMVSHPDKVMVISLESDTDQALNFEVDFNSLLKYEQQAGQNRLEIEGYAPYHAEPNYRGDMRNAVRFDPERGTRFSNLISIKSTDGEIKHTDHSLSITNANKAVILVSVATSFNGFDKDPASEGRDHNTISKSQLEQASTYSLEQLKLRHTEDYRSYFDRLSISLEGNRSDDLPTDQRLKKYAEGNEDRGLEELYFQFGRYLLISSSRTPEVPANLQGIWNPYMRPPWSSNYTANINLEENYWLAEVANLSEMHEPLLGFIANLAKTGEVSAKTFYGVEKGWSVAHNSDIWAMSNPVGDFGKGHPVWANWNMAGVWLSTHLWEHYVFTQDKAFLKNRAYPLMKGAVDFSLGWMTEDKNGSLITSPSTSPENIYQIPGGYRGATLYGATGDLAMIRELLMQTIRASEILNESESFRQEMQDALSKLHPYQVGKAGNLQEWYHDWEDADPQHRHQTHLFGLYPGNQIDPEKTPELAEASRVTLDIKGDKSTGWSQGWRINLWARLKDGNRAYKLYRQLLRYVDPTGLETNYMNGGGTYPNLLDAHPPFQIDGNFGGAAGVLEMLIHSTEKSIELLPALPDTWTAGRLKGVKARGGFTLDMVWEKGRLLNCTIYSEKGAETEITYTGQTRQINLKPGERLKLEW